MIELYVILLIIIAIIACTLLVCFSNKLDKNIGLDNNYSQNINLDNDLYNINQKLTRLELRDSFKNSDWLRR